MQTNNKIFKAILQNGTLHNAFQVPLASQIEKTEHLPALHTGQRVTAVVFKCSSKELLHITLSLTNSYLFLSTTNASVPYPLPVSGDYSRA